VIEERKHLCTK